VDIIRTVYYIRDPDRRETEKKGNGRKGNGKKGNGKLGNLAIVFAVMLIRPCTGHKAKAKDFQHSPRPGQGQGHTANVYETKLKLVTSLTYCTASQLR